MNFLFFILYYNVVNLYGMKALNKKFNEIVEVEPFYLYGRIVAYVGDDFFKRMGVELSGDGKQAYLPDELDFNV